MKVSENNSKDLTVFIINTLVSIFILFQALSGFGARDMDFGLVLFFANIFISFSLSYLFQKGVFLKWFLIFSFMLQTSTITLVLFGDRSPLLGRLVIFLIIESIISGLFFGFYKMIIQKQENLKNNIKPFSLEADSVMYDPNIHKDWRNSLFSEHDKTPLSDTYFRYNFENGDIIYIKTDEKGVGQTPPKTEKFERTKM